MTQEATVAKEVKTAVVPFSKDDYIGVVQPLIEETLGVRISKDKCWNLVKVCMGAGYELAAQGKPCSLAGVGKFEVITSGRSGHKIMKFRVSSSIQEALQAGASKFTKVVTVAAEAPTEAAPVEAAPTVAAPASQEIL